MRGRALRPIIRVCAVDLRLTMSGVCGPRGPIPLARGATRSALLALSRKDPSVAAAQPFLPFSRPSITPKDIAAVTAVLQSGWITTGAQCAELERAPV